MLNPESVAQAAALLVAARHTRTPLPRLPETCRPANVADALAIQAATVALLHERVAGWKVGTVVDGALTYGVLLASRVMRSPGRFAAADVPPLGMEAEVAFRFLRDVPPRAEAYTYAEVAERVVAFPAIEVVATRYVDYATTPFLERLADCMSNGGFVIGVERLRWRTFDLPQLPVTLQFAGEVIVDHVGGHQAGDPLLPAIELVNTLRTTTGVTAGQVMTTGTYSGLNFAQPGQHVRVNFAGFGSAEVDTTV